MLPPARRGAAQALGDADQQARALQHQVRENREPDGEWTFTYQMVRSQCLLAAKACGVPAIETIFANFRDADGLSETCRLARRDGFDGLLIAHVAGEDRRVALLGIDVGLDASGLFEVDIENADVRAVASQRMADGLADAAAATGDDGCFAG